MTSGWSHTPRWHASVLSLAVFLIPAFSLALPTGYSWGAALLVLLGLLAVGAVLLGVGVLLLARLSATSSAVTTWAVMYAASVVACFDRSSAASRGVGCQSGGYVMVSFAGRRPPVGPCFAARSTRTMRL